MALLRSLRVTLYGFILAIGISQNVVAAFLTPYAWRFNEEVGHFLPYFSLLATIFAFLTWIWTSVLLSYNNKPGSNHNLAFAFPHFVSFLVMAIVWLAVAIMLLSERGYSCRNGIGPEGLYLVWCGLGTATGVLSLALCLLCASIVFLIYQTVQKSGSFQCKLLEQDGDLSNSLPSPKVQVGPMPMATKIRTALYSVILVFGLAENIITPFAAVLGKSLPDDREIETITFESLASVFSCLTWILASILLSFNRRPYINRTLTRASTHCYVLVTLSAVWLAIMIMILSQTKHNCPVNAQAYDDFQCPIFIPTAVLAFVLAVLLGGTALFVYTRTKKGGGKLSTCNVAEYDGEIFQDVDLQIVRQP